MLPSSCPTKFENSLKSLSNSSAMATRSFLPSFQGRTFAHSYSVPNSLHKTFAERFAPACTDDVSLTILSRIFTDLQGSSCRFCGHGIHWLFCQAHPHSNVRHSFFLGLSMITSDFLPHRNNILVYVIYVCIITGSLLIFTQRRGIDCLSSFCIYSHTVIYGRRPDPKSTT